MEAFHEKDLVGIEGGEIGEGEKTESTMADVANNLIIEIDRKAAELKACCESDLVDPECVERLRDLTVAHKKEIDSLRAKAEEEIKKVLHNSEQRKVA